MRHQPPEFYMLMDELSACRTRQARLAIQLWLIVVARWVLRRTSMVRYFVVKTVDSGCYVWDSVELVKVGDGLNHRDAQSLAAELNLEMKKEAQREHK